MQHNGDVSLESDKYFVTNLFVRQNGPNSKLKMFLHHACQLSANKSIT